jgi:hypothetical protein
MRKRCGFVAIAVLVGLASPAAAAPAAEKLRRSASGLELDVTVPANATGRVYVPAPRPEAVTEGAGGTSVAAAQAPSVKLVGVEGDRVVYEVGSGRYQFRVAVSP